MNFGFVRYPPDQALEWSGAAQLSALEARMVKVSSEADDLWDLAAKADESGRMDLHEAFADQATAKEAEYADLLRQYGEIERK